MRPELEPEQSEILSALRAAYETQREDFVVVYMDQGTVIKHPQFTFNGGRVREMDLVALEQEGFLRVARHDDRGRPKVFVPRALPTMISGYVIASPEGREEGVRLLREARQPFVVLQDAGGLPKQLMDHLDEIVRRLDQIERQLGIELPDASAIAEEQRRVMGSLGWVLGATALLGDLGSIVSGALSLPEALSKVPQVIPAIERVMGLIG